jgi:hypothetical protein
MASEITASASISVRNGNMNENIASGAKMIDQAAVGGPSPGYVTIGTSEESVSLSEISTLGWVYIQNLDPTNYVRFGFSTGVYGARLLPGEFAMFRFNPGASLFMIANTAACKCQVKAFEA